MEAQAGMSMKSEEGYGGEENRENGEDNKEQGDMSSKRLQGWRGD